MFPEGAGERCLEMVNGVLMPDYQHHEGPLSVEHKILTASPSPLMGFDFQEALARLFTRWIKARFQPATTFPQSQFGGHDKYFSYFTRTTK
jgi:hypothetical protein